MANAQKAFRTAYGMIRKYSESLMGDSFDHGVGGVDDEAMRQRSAHLVARKLGVPANTPMPCVDYLATIAAANAVMQRQPRVQRAVQQRLEDSRDTYIYD